MKIRDFTPLQKKKIGYSILALFVVGLIAVSSYLLWDQLGSLSWSEIRTRIVTSIGAYFSLIFLGFKVVWFFVVETRKQRKRHQEIEKAIIKPIGDSMKKTKDTKNIKKFEKEFVCENFKFQILNAKEIKIVAINDFTSTEDYYKKIKSDMGNFHELLRKYLAGEIE